MTRFAWLQSRTQTLVAVVLLAALGVTAAITGVHLSHLYHSLVAPCAASGGCDLALGQFLSHDQFLQDSLTFLLRIAPAVIGVFWGAPLIARELETGTYRLAWTQGVSRSRWVVTKLAVVVLISAAVAGLLTLTITWWFRAVDTAGGSTYGVYDARNIVPIAYTVLAVTLGALIGVMVRRTLPAMAATLGVFLFARVAIQQWVRPHLLPPLHAVISLGRAEQFGFMQRNSGDLTLVAKAGAPDDGWALSTQIVTRSGHVTSAAERAAFLHHNCPSIAPGVPPKGHSLAIRTDDADAFKACSHAASRVYHLVVTYQPGSRYWSLQWLETGVFLALALAAAAGCYWWVTRRVS